ncbi:ABC transporter substrate-binding protein [Actinomadura sp. 7K507]|uniref:ABC transporter substrate-binding protein n=1 Tax=Actinomadura sp. 7K507 TaxID=2530365 RepID=UPI00104C35A6|nr:ABC transporter substrate-binding protein [Actinomadura sp. 7K507]TDC88523.1 ABC transporter substrate-binding protein [Actinomadura sp. 7K507]
MTARGGRILRRRAGIAVIAVLALVTTACGGTGNSDSRGSVTSVSMLTTVLPPVLDPRQSSSLASGSLLIALEPLVRYDGGEFKPLLAAAIENPDPKTYVLTIRDGVEFWDGSPFTAEDAAFSIDLHTGDDSESVNAALFGQVKSVEVTGDREVTVSLSAPDPQFTAVLAQIGMVSESFYGKNGKRVGTQDVLNMGTGPYEFAAFTPTRELTLDANDGYWGENKPELKTVKLGVVGDDAARMNALQSRQYDGMLNVPLPQVASIRGLPGMRIADSADLSVYKFNLNVETEPWDDIHLRRAFQKALNRQAIIKGALGGNADPAPTVVPEPVMAGLAGKEATRTAYAKLGDDIVFDLDAARSEIAKSSSPGGVSSEVLVTGSDPTLALIVQTAAQDLAKIGIELKVREVDDQTYYSAVYFEHETDGVSIDMFSGSAPDASNLPMYVLNGANAVTTGGSGTNISDYVNGDVDALLGDSRKLAVDDPKRGALLLEALTLGQADVPYVPIASPKVFIAGRNGLDVPSLSTFWWMTQWPEALVAP